MTHHHLCTKHFMHLIFVVITLSNAPVPYCQMAFPNHLGKENMRVWEVLYRLLNFRCPKVISNRDGSIQNIPYHQECYLLRNDQE